MKCLSIVTFNGLHCVEVCVDRNTTNADCVCVWGGGFGNSRFSDKAMGWAIRDLIPGGGKGFFSHPKLLDRVGAHITPSLMDQGLPGINGRMVEARS
jgi:hypothetical protein